MALQRQHPILNVDEHYCKESIAKGRSNFYQVGPLAPGFYEIRVSYRAIVRQDIFIVALILFISPQESCQLYSQSEEPRHQWQ